MLAQLAKGNHFAKKGLFIGSSKTGTDSRIWLLTGFCSNLRVES
jgi:hypothetical protein